MELTDLGIEQERGVGLPITTIVTSTSTPFLLPFRFGVDGEDFLKVVRRVLPKQVPRIPSSRPPEGQAVFAARSSTGHPS